LIAIGFRDARESVAPKISPLQHHDLPPRLWTLTVAVGT
jgi:hypothetical protein